MDRERDIALAAEELSLSGIIGLRFCSRSTVYRWTKTINDYLEANKYDWRVKADYKERAIKVIT